MMENLDPKNLKIRFVPGVCISLLIFRFRNGLSKEFLNAAEWKSYQLSVKCLKFRGLP